MEGHEQSIINLKIDLEASQLEVKNLLQENTELHDALKSARENTKLLVQQSDTSQVPLPMFLDLSHLIQKKLKTKSLTLLPGDNIVNSVAGKRM